MEVSQTHPAGAIADDDLVALARTPGPFLSVALTTDPRIDNASYRSMQRWRALRADVDVEQIDPTTLTAIESAIADAHHEGDAVVVIASPQEVRHVEHGPALAQDGLSWGRVPNLRPLIRWRTALPTTVVVLVDRTGADLFALRHAAPDIRRTVEGDDSPIRKVAPGGWSQRRFQQRAENTWEENAGEVGRAVESLSDRVDPRLIVLAGDVRAVGLLRDALPQALRDRVEVVPGERPWDGATETIPDEVGEAVAGAVDRDARRLVDRVTEELGQHDLAVDGLDAVTRALAAAQVDTLLIGDGLRDATLWAGADPAHLSGDPRTLEALGVEAPFEAPTGDVLVRAALGTGARVWVTDPARRDPSVLDVRDGVAALLRWPVGPKR